MTNTVWAGTAPPQHDAENDHDNYLVFFADVSGGGLPGECLKASFSLAPPG
jgi:hypothetical protein